jgi:tRNA synthetases class I (E and Q), catalytic domain
MHMLLGRSECGLRPRRLAHCMSAAPAQRCTTFCLLAATAASSSSGGFAVVLSGCALTLFGAYPLHMVKAAGGMRFHRVEDTDLARSTQQSEQNLMEELRWLGINWDEGECVGRQFMSMM